MDLAAVSNPYRTGRVLSPGHFLRAAVSLAAGRLQPGPLCAALG
jgi:hypothetical protein